LTSAYSPVRKLAATDQVDAFDCGQAALNQFLQRYALVNQKANSAQTYVCCQGDVVVGYDAVKIKALRERLHLSQAVLASVLNTSASTVRKSEVGDKRPSGPSQKLLDILDRKGLEAVL